MGYEYLYYNSYPLLKRAMYYIARLISAQFATEFEGLHYEKLKKVYSIWICMNTPRDHENTVNTYRIIVSVAVSARRF